MSRRGLGAAGWVGLGIVGAFALMAAAAPWLAQYRVTALAGDPLQAPSLQHWLGTNSVGQDVASQLVAGARTSLLVAVIAGGGTVVLGSLVGGVAGWAGGLADALAMRVADVILVVPAVPLLIVIGAYTTPSIGSISVIIALTSWPGFARIVRAQVLSLRQRAHIRAAVGFGATTGRVIRAHIGPALTPVLVAALVGAAERAIAIEAGLAFLGLGRAGVSWGSAIRDALAFRGLFFTNAWSWWLLPPVLAISLVLVGVALVGTAVEERLDPRLARSGRGRLRSRGG
ncbi:MAG TPA: ABC transporter permease [Acidimicrobiales bacterium]|nr:ABC transporter permease [Acidimicrobiales bacterium]